MGFELLYWHWIVLGFILMLSEIFIGSFFIFWFGASALSVGVAMLAIPNMSEAAQIIIWGFASLMFALGWFKFIKPLSRDNTKAGLSKEALLGQIWAGIRPAEWRKVWDASLPRPTSWIRRMANHFAR